ncbi:MAG: hypothetical protein KA758_13955 [Acidimicrobiales bacterium]|nr:hypothetical protein [Acidimicrobiales bacterium]
MSSFTGTARIVRLVLRRDRLRLALWMGGVTSMVVISAASLLATYPDQATIDAYGSVFSGNPALVAFAGPGYGMDDPNIGVILVNEVQLWGLITLGLMSVFLVNRHTRAEEDVERADLLRSSVLGRHAVAAATVAVVTAAHVVVAAVCAAGFVALGYAPVGSVALALSYLAMGWMFVGVTLVAAQVAGSGRGTLGLASIVLGVSFVVRAVGDVADSAIRWASPMAWPQSVRAFAGEQWWVLGLCVAVGAVLVVSGFWLSTRRDLGSGFLTPAAGRARAGRMLRHPVGFAVHLHRWALLSWTLAMFVLGLVYASVADDIEEMMVDNPVYADLLAQLQGADPTESYLATVLVMQALMVAGYAIATVLHLHTEEASSRVEQVLATATSRTRWMASYLTLAAAGTVVITVASSLGTGLSYAWVTDDGAQVGRLVVAGLVTLPAVAVLAGVTVALFGWWPRGVAGAWGVLAATTVVAILAEVLRLPTWVRQLSPFTHLPKVPAEAVHWPPVLILSAVAVALTAAGVWGFNRRDIQAH